VKLARKTQVDEKMDIDGDERRRSSEMEALNARSTSTNAAASQEPPFAFKMAQELTFSMLAHALRSTRDGPNCYVTVLLTFLQSVLRNPNPECLASLERAIPWKELAAFLSKGPRASSSWAQNEKLSQSNILLEDWAIRGIHVVRTSLRRERGFWNGKEDQLMEMRCLIRTTSPPRPWTRMACGRTTRSTKTETKPGDAGVATRPVGWCVNGEEDQGGGMQEDWAMLRRRQFTFFLLKGLE